MPQKNMIMKILLLEMIFKSLYTQMLVFYNVIKTGKD